MNGYTEFSPRVRRAPRPRKSCLKRIPRGPGWQRGWTTPGDGAGGARGWPGAGARRGAPGLMPVANLIRKRAIRPLERLEVAAGNSQSPPSRTRRPSCVRRPMHLCVRNHGLPNQNRNRHKPGAGKAISPAGARGARPAGLHLHVWPAWRAWRHVRHTPSDENPSPAVPRSWGRGAELFLPPLQSRGTGRDRRTSTMNSVDSADSADSV
jgi:hypothetical protein